MLLAIETASATAAVALMQDGGLLGEYMMRQAHTHSQTMLPMLETLMQELHVAPADISAIAVNIGPGSFTGVRIGVCTANAMGAALQIPVIGVSALASLYENVRVLQGPVCALIDAKNGGAYAALFKGGEAIKKDEAVSVEAYIQALPLNTLFVGDGAAAYKEMIVAAVRGATFAPDIANMHRASSLCSIANSILRKGEAIGMQVTPSYLKLSQAERMLEEKKTRILYE